MWHAYSAVSLCLSGTGQAATRKDVSNHQRIRVDSGDSSMYNRW